MHDSCWLVELLNTLNTSGLKRMQTFSSCKFNADQWISTGGSGPTFGFWLGHSLEGSPPPVRKCGSWLGLHQLRTTDVDSSAPPCGQGGNFLFERFFFRIVNVTVFFFKKRWEMLSRRLDQSSGWSDLFLTVLTGSYTDMTCYRSDCLLFPDLNNNSYSYLSNYLYIFM